MCKKSSVQNIIIVRFQNAIQTATSTAKCHTNNHFNYKVPYSHFNCKMSYKQPLQLQNTIQTATSTVKLNDVLNTAFFTCVIMIVFLAIIIVDIQTGTNTVVFDCLVLF